MKIINFILLNFIINVSIKKEYKFIGDENMEINNNMEQFDIHGGIGDIYKGGLYNLKEGPSSSTAKLKQGMFLDKDIPDAQVIMTTTPSKKILNNYGMGLITYLCDEVGPPKKDGKSTFELMDELAKLPLGNKLYIRVNWKDVQAKPGRLDLSDHWKIAFELAEKYSKRIGFRIMLSNPNIPGYAAPDFVLEKVPFVKMGERFGKMQYEPRYDDPYFLSAFKELNYLLADKYDGHPLVEFVDTFMYGFWGEGHTCGITEPLVKNPFPDFLIAQNTFNTMFSEQLNQWVKTPLVTNTQPDCSRVGNAEIVDRTIKTSNWLRTDTIFIECEQIEVLSNRPPWTAVVSEMWIADGVYNPQTIDEGITNTDNAIYHVMDIGANYWSLWNWHNIGYDNIIKYYKKYPEVINKISHSIGYRIRPSWIWYGNYIGNPSLIIAFVNDGIAGVPGNLIVSLIDINGKIIVEGSLDAGYPIPRKVRQVLFPLPKDIDWKKLKLKVQIEIKGVKYPVEWACHENINKDGTLTLRQSINI